MKDEDAVRKGGNIGLDLLLLVWEVAFQSRARNAVSLCFSVFVRALQQLKRLMLSSIRGPLPLQKRKKGNKQKFRHDGEKNEREMNTDQGGVEPPQKVGCVCVCVCFVFLFVCLLACLFCFDCFGLFVLFVLLVMFALILCVYILCFVLFRFVLFSLFSCFLVFSVFSLFVFVLFCLLCFILLILFVLFVLLGLFSLLNLFSLFNLFVCVVLFCRV